MCTHTHTHTHTMSNQIQSQCTYALHTALDAQKWRKPNCVTIANCHSSLIFFVQTYAPDAQQLKWCWCRTHLQSNVASNNHQTILTNYTILYIRSLQTSTDHVTIHHMYHMYVQHTQIKRCLTNTKQVVTTNIYDYIEGKQNIEKYTKK